MAIANSDGSIILSTKVDESGLKAWFASVNSSAKTAKENIAGIGTQATASAKTAKTAIASVGTALKALFPMLIGIQTIIKAIDFSNEAGQLATQAEASVQRLVDIYGSASDSVGDFIDANARALGMSKAAAASFSSVYGNLFSVWADQATNAELTNRYLNMTAVVASKTGRTVEDVQERVRSGLLGNTEAIEDLGIFVNVKTIEMTDAFQRMANGKSWEQLDAYTQQQIRSMAILEQATAKYGDEVADTSATIRNRFNAAYQDFQNTWGEFINTVLLPILEVLTQVFDIATKGMNALMGKSGKTLEDAEANADASKETADNIKEQADNQKDLNDQMKKTLAGFDDIQILSAGTAETTKPPNLNILGDTEPDGSSYVEEVNSTLMGIMGIVSLALVAVGLILLFTGNIAWGIGFIVAGAATLTVTMASASEFGYDGIIGMLTTIMGIAGGALLALGIILLWIGGVVGKPVAIGMIIAGGALIVSAVAAKAAFAPDDIAAWLSLIMGIAGGALLALGIILCMVGSVPLGVGMIIAGAVSIVSAVALNSDAVVEAIRGPIGIITAIVSGALLVLGIILTCSGILPLGIGLIAAGAIGLATVVSLNWNSIKEKIKKTWNSIKEWIETYGMLVLGIILCLTVAGIPLGIAIILKWAKENAEEVPLAAKIIEKVKEVWDSVKKFWDENIKPIFTEKFWSDLAKKCGNGLIGGFEAAINGIIGMFEKMINWIVDGLNKISFDVPDWVPGIGGKKFGFNIQEAKFDRVSIPRLAQGAVIPPNREFLAVLGDQRQGTNIETPLATMIEAFQMALDSRARHGGGNTEVVLEIDGREFGRAVVEQGNRENRRIGTRLVIA